MPAVQFEPWDRTSLERGNFIDMGVLAHRPDDGVRFDERLRWFGDWDLALQLTADRDPLELPAIAVYYRTGLDDRLSGAGDRHQSPPAEADEAIVRATHGLAPAPDHPQLG
jgi:hypothetical protein